MLPQIITRRIGPFNSPSLSYKAAKKHKCDQVRLSDGLNFCGEGQPRREVQTIAHLKNMRLDQGARVPLHQLSGKYG